MDQCDRKGAVITISPGALGALRWVGWKGSVHVCDICKACVDSAAGMRRYFPELKMGNPINASIQNMTALWCHVNGRAKLSAVDVDLAFTLPNTRPILDNVLATLIRYKVSTKVLLTYVNHRDGLAGNFHADNSRRIALLKSWLPRGVKYVGSHNYASGWSNEHHKYSKGSAMSVAMLEVKAA